MKNLSLTFCVAITTLLASVGSGFASDLPPCRGESMWYGHNCFGKWNDKEYRYQGEYKNAKQHGIGTVQFLNGAKYTGRFKNGLMTEMDF